MTEKEHKPTKAEAERIENYSKQAARLESEGYTATKCVVSILKANVYALFLFIPFGLVFSLIFYSAGGSFVPDISHIQIWNLLLLLVVFFALIIVHEGLHGLTWALFCKAKFKSIQFGIIPSNLTPYCTCLEPLGFKAYLLGALMPLLVLGIGSIIIAAATKNCYWFYFANIAALTAGGDIYVALMLLRHKKALVLDHPTECGFYAFEKAHNR